MRMISEDSFETMVFSGLSQSTGHGDAAGIGGIGLGVDLVQEIEAVKRVARGAILGQECPAVLAHEMVHDRDRDDVFELLQLAEDQRAVCPRTGERHVEMVAAGLRLEAARAALGRFAVGRDPVTPFRLRADELAARCPGFIPAVRPFSVDQQSHDFHVLRVSRHVGGIGLQSKTLSLEQIVTQPEKPDGRAERLVIAGTAMTSIFAKIRFDRRRMGARA